MVLLLHYPTNFLVSTWPFPIRVVADSPTGQRLEMRIMERLRSIELGLAVMLDQTSVAHVTAGTLAPSPYTALQIKGEPPSSAS